MKRLWPLLLAWLVPALVLAGTVRVPKDHATIQAAVVAAFPGDTVLVAPGTYVENVMIQGKENLTLLGAEGPEKTIVDGDEKGSVIVIAQCPGRTTVEGLTVQRGYTAGNGGGILVQQTEAVLRNCQFLDNTADNEGGGASIVNPQAYLVEGCLFERNESAAAAAIGIVGGRGAFLGNRVQNNTGGLTISVMFSGCDVRDNLIVRNLSTGFGCIGYQMALASVVEGNTIAMNLGKEGSGAILAQFGDLRISRNLIVENDGVCGILVESNDGLVRLRGNDVWNNEGGDYKGTAPGEGDISEDPLFCDPDKGDYRLRPGSPALGDREKGRIGSLGECS